MSKMKKTVLPDCLFLICLHFKCNHVRYITGYGRTNAFIKAHEFVFRGATDERTDFLLQFLKELKIDK
jgi:hypothetical protein